jgi:regulator of protease activity HflC (stomatin/prohibitin superfamily)
MLAIILGTLAIPFGIGFVIFLFMGLKVVNQYERGVKFTLGRHTGPMKPGLRFVFPFIQSWIRVDIRTKVLDVPSQDAMTKDNVSVNINAVVYYKVTRTDLAILEIRDYNYAASQLSQISMKNVVGEVTLDQLLTNRDEISKKIQQIVDKATDPWGIKVEAVDLKHIEVPESLKRVMAQEAEAEREKRGVIIKAQGEVTAATNLAKAAHQLSSTPGAMHIRTLHSINSLSSDRSQTTIYAMPVEVLRMVKKMGGR